MQTLPPTLAELPNVLTIEEYARIQRISRTTAYELARRNELPIPVIRCGRRMFVSKLAVIRLLDHCSHEPAVGLRDQQSIDTTNHRSTSARP